MPYIRPESRDPLTPHSEWTATSAGELNYQITVLIRQYVTVHGVTYDTLNVVVGALESAKAEFQRRVVAPYEDEKIRQSGDVY